MCGECWSCLHQQPCLHGVLPYTTLLRMLHTQLIVYSTYKGHSCVGDAATWEPRGKCRILSEQTAGLLSAPKVIFLIPWLENKNISFSTLDASSSTLFQFVSYYLSSVICTQMFLALIQLSFPLNAFLSSFLACCSAIVGVHMSHIAMVVWWDQTISTSMTQLSMCIVHMLLNFNCITIKCTWLFGCTNISI